MAINHKEYGLNIKGTSRKVLITRRDRDLLKYIYLGKIATRQQIHRDIFNKAGLRTMQLRLQLLSNHGLIERRSFMKSNKAHYYYAVTKQSLPYVAQELGGLEIVRSEKSENIQHDITLVDIRNIVLSKSQVVGYYPENLLQTCEVFQNDPKFKAFVNINSDAALELNSTNGKFLMALEYEASGQSAARYREKLASYYQADWIPIVLYVCEKPCTIETLKNVDLELRKEMNAESKMYFSLRSDVHLGLKELRFINTEKYAVVIR